MVFAKAFRTPSYIVNVRSLNNFRDVKITYPDQIIENYRKKKTLHFNKVIPVPDLECLGHSMQFYKEVEN